MPLQQPRLPTHAYPLRFGKTELARSFICTRSLPLSGNLRPLETAKGLSSRSSRKTSVYHERASDPKSIEKTSAPPFCLPPSSTIDLGFLSYLVRDDPPPPPPRRPRFLFAAAAAAAAFAVGRLVGSWPSKSFASDPRLCDPKVGCTPLQLAAKRLTPLAAGRKHAFGSVQEAWNSSTGINLIDVVDRIIGEKDVKCVVNLGKSFWRQPGPWPPFSSSLAEFFPLHPHFYPLSLILLPFPFLPFLSWHKPSQKKKKGALDGYTDDPTYPLFKRGACGAAFEGDELILDLLEENLALFRKNGVAIMKEYAHPVTMPARLRAAGITAGNLDVLKVDVDGFDLALARSILEAGFRPKVVLMESNTDVPAPFAYETAYRHDYGVYFQLSASFCFRVFVGAKKKKSRERRKKKEKRNGTAANNEKRRT